MNESKIDILNTILPGGYRGGDAPENLKAEVKEWPRDELELRYLDAVVRANDAIDNMIKASIDSTDPDGEERVLVTRKVRP